MTDLELAHAIVRGSDAACAEFVHRYRGLCFHVVRRFVASDDEAFDLCQDTFIRAFSRLHQYRGESPLSAWVGRVAFNLAQRRAEQVRGRREVPWDEAPALEDTLPSEAAAPDVALEALTEAGRLHQALARLGAAEHTVITLFHLEELSLAEIATITGLPEGTIKSHLFRGRQRLRKWLGTDLAPEVSP